MARGLTAEKKKELVDALKSRFGDRVNRAHIADVAEELGIPFTQTAFIRNIAARVDRGIYLLPGSTLKAPVSSSNGTDGTGDGTGTQNVENESLEVSSSKKPKKVSVKAVQEKINDLDVVEGRISTVEVGDLENYIPKKDPLFVKFGDYNRIKQVVKSGIFFPMFITGLTGNGKTLSVYQICAELKRELIRVNVTIETDEDDLLGGFRLVNGETVFHYGPVIESMIRGTVLLLDEIDLGSNKMLCLQPVLEGKGIYLKKINKYIEPAPGFTVIATANTKGKGSEDGSYIGTNILNEAFLDRFILTFEQDYPSEKVEFKIVKKVLDSLGVSDDDFAQKLTLWANLVRDGFKNGACTSVIATRRLVGIAKTFAIFKDRFTAIELCVARFNEEDRVAFVEYYEKATADVPEPTTTSETDDPNAELKIKIGDGEVELNEEGLPLTNQQLDDLERTF